MTKSFYSMLLVTVLEGKPIVIWSIILKIELLQTDMKCDNMNLAGKYRIITLKSKTNKHQPSHGFSASELLCLSIQI